MKGLCHENTFEPTVEKDGLFLQSIFLKDAESFETISLLYLPNVEKSRNARPQWPGQCGITGFQKDVLDSRQDQDTLLLESIDNVHSV